MRKAEWGSGNAEGGMGKWEWGRRNGEVGMRKSECGIGKWVKAGVLQHSCIFHVAIPQIATDIPITSSLDSYPIIGYKFRFYFEKSGKEEKFWLTATIHIEKPSDIFYGCLVF
jgi:hypothetical protein